MVKKQTSIQIAQKCIQQKIEVLCHQFLMVSVPDGKIAKAGAHHQNIYTLKGMINRYRINLYISHIK